MHVGQMYNLNRNTCLFAGKSVTALAQATKAAGPDDVVVISVIDQAAVLCQGGSLKG